MASALLGAALVTNYGWKIMFYIAIIPFIALPILWKFLPESLMYMTKKGETEKLRYVVAKIAPKLKIHPSTTFKLDEPVAGDEVPLSTISTRTYVQYSDVLGGILYVSIDGLCIG